METKSVSKRQQLDQSTEDSRLQLYVNVYALKILDEGYICHYTFLNSRIQILYCKSIMLVIIDSFYLMDTNFCGLR